MKRYVVCNPEPHRFSGSNESVDVMSLLNEDNPDELLCNLKHMAYGRQKQRV